MKKSVIVVIAVLVLTILLVPIMFLTKEKDYPDDENTLYSVKFNNVKIRVERYDYSLGQNQVVGVQKSNNKGKDYEDVTEEKVTVSMEPKFVFLNETMGFIITKPLLTKNNNYAGVKVTIDGGKTFKNSTVNYDNPDIETLTIEGVPYLEKDILKLPCSIYQSKEDLSGYETIKITFVSTDNGLTWNLEQSNEQRYKQIKSDIDAEMKRYLNAIAPNCNSDNAGGHLTHRDLVYNNGFDKEKLLDVNNKSYCKAYIRYKCVKKGKWEWTTTISCKDYTDKDYQDFAYPFEDKK